MHISIIALMSLSDNENSVPVRVETQLDIDIPVLHALGAGGTLRGIWGISKVSSPSCCVLDLDVDSMLIPNAVVWLSLASGVSVGLGASLLVPSPVSLKPGSRFSRWYMMSS